MYMERMIEVSKAQNGFVVSCNVPLKADAKSTNKMDCCCSPGSANRQYVAKDAKEVADLIEDIMPLLDGDFKTEDDFDKAFAEATTSAEDAKEDGK